jgi:hypothetical protein
VARVLCATASWVDALPDRLAVSVITIGELRQESSRRPVSRAEIGA